MSWAAVRRGAMRVAKGVGRIFKVAAQQKAQDLAEDAINQGAGKLRKTVKRRLDL